MDINKILDRYRIELNKTMPINDVEWEFLKISFSLKTYKRKDILIELNKVTNKIFLIVEGYVQLFHMANNKEYTIDFFSPPLVVTSFESFIHRKPSKLCVKAINELTVLEANYEPISEAYMHFQPIQKLSRYFTEYALISRLRSEYDNNILSAKEKYFHLFEKHPNLISNLSQKQIASYIGIAPESLCRIKKSLGIDKKMLNNNN